jgi:hypothetical protein
MRNNLFWLNEDQSGRIAPLVPAEKLHPAIPMMKSAEDWPCGDLAAPLDRPMARQILLQRQMCSEFVVIADVGCKDPAQLGVPAAYPIRRSR